MTEHVKRFSKITSFNMSMARWILITRILTKYNKSLSSLIDEYINNFIEAHIHVLYEDEDIAYIIHNNPGVSLEALGEMVLKLSSNKIIRSRFGKIPKLDCNHQVANNYLSKVPKIIDDGGQFK